MTPDEKAAWLAARCGKLTASRMNDALDFRKDGQPGARRIKLLHELLAERLTGYSVPHVVTDAMEHGLEYEAEAVDVFVGMTGREPKLSRFYEHPTIENFGATPDRELDDGLLEVKCPTSATFIQWKIAGVVPEQHKAQMTAQCACAGRGWVGFVAYDPRIKTERQRLFLAKHVPTAAEIKEIEDAARSFLQTLDLMFAQFTEAA
jgi:hypothetical protein